MTKKQILQRRNLLNDVIFRVLASCKTDAQLIAAYCWGTDVITTYIDFIERTGTSNNIHFAYRHLMPILNNISEQYLGKVLEKIKLRPSNSIVGD